MSSLRVRPTFDEFRALARDYTVVPVWAELLADLDTPVSAYLKLVGDGEGFPSPVRQPARCQWPWCYCAFGGTALRLTRLASSW